MVPRNKEDDDSLLVSEYPELRKNINQGKLVDSNQLYSHSVRFWQDFLLYLHILTLETNPTRSERSLAAVSMFAALPKRL